MLTRDAFAQLLHENVRYAVTETCLALTIFRDEINFHVVVLFTSLVFLKVFHWLAQSRIEFVRVCGTSVNHGVRCGSDCDGWTDGWTLSLLQPD